MNVSFARTILPIVALSMGALGYFHVQQTSQSAPQTKPFENPARVPFEHSVAGSGMVEAQSENIAIGAALPGLVLEVFLPSRSVGQRVEAGTPLFRTDDRHLKAQLTVAEAQLSAAQAVLAKLEQQPRPESLPPSLAKVKVAAAKVTMSDDLYRRAARLTSTSVITQEEFVTREQTYESALHEQEQAQAEYDLLQAGAWKPDLVIAEATVKEARAKVEQLQTEIGRALVVAPVDGVILQVNVRPGERISDMDNKPLMVLGDIETFHVRIDVDERDLPRLVKGAPAKAYPRGDSSREMSLRFVRIEPYVVPKKALTGENTERVDTRVLQVLYAIERTEHPVYVGQQLDVFIDGNNALADRDRESYTSRGPN